MLDDDDDDDGLLLPKHLKFVSLGGEKMSKSIKDSFRESGITLLNVYVSRRLRCTKRVRKFQLPRQKKKK